MYQDEPFLVLATQEVLEKRDIAKRYGAGMIESLPVVQGIRGVGKDRWTAKPLCNCVPGNGDIRREILRGLVLPPNVGMADIRENHHRPPERALVRQRFDLKSGKRPQNPPRA